MVVKLTFLDRLKISFQADGSYSGRKDKYTGELTGTVAIRYSLKKDRKKERLKYLLNELPYEYSWSEYDNKYCSVRVKLPVKDFNMFNKELTSMFDPLTKSREWCRDFIEEISLWDGYKNKQRPNNIGYSSVIKSNVEFVVGVAHCAGYSATFRERKDNRSDCKRKTIYATNINILNREV